MFGTKICLSLTFLGFALQGVVLAQDPILEENNACQQYDAYPTRALNPDCSFNPNVIATVPELAAHQNIAIVSYNITTSDGYILAIFNIPPQDPTQAKSPIYIQHGILTNAECWTDLGEDSLAFRLAAQNHDVWLGTVRGALYGRQHVSLSDTDPEFWNFPLDPLGLIDLRESLLFVANKTGKAGEILLMAHSMGTTMSMMYNSAYPSEAASLLQGNIMLSPVVFLTDIPLSPAAEIAAVPLQTLTTLLDINVLFFNDQELHLINTLACSLLPDTCVTLMEVVSGPSTQFPPKDLLLAYGHLITATATQQFYHYFQIMETGIFKKFDYGTTGNLQKYGVAVPPAYNLRNVRLPTFFLYGDNDYLATPPNVQAAFSLLGSPQKTLLKIPQNSSCAPFSHVDFLWSTNIDDCFYADLFQIIQNNFS